MKIRYLTITFYLLASLILPIKSIATHTAVFEIFYHWVSDSTYQITVAFYKNCQGLTSSAPTAISVKVKSISTGKNQMVSLPKMPTGQGFPATGLHGVLNCSNDNFCFEEYVYRANWTCPKRAADWVFSYELCCLALNLVPDNLNMTSSYAECGLNNLDFHPPDDGNMLGYFHNRRPNVPSHLKDTLINYPFLSTCGSRLVRISENVSNFDGDRVHYTFMVPQDAGGAAATFKGGFSLSNPFPATGITLDSLTGMLSFTPGIPTGNGYYMIGIKATEYRTDTFLVGGFPVVEERQIGYANRHMYITIEDSASCPDSSYAFVDSINPLNPVNLINITCDNNPLAFGFNFKINCASIDTNGSCVRLFNAANMTSIPILGILKPKCDQSSFVNKFSIKLNAPLSPGSYFLVIETGTDGNTLITECGLEIPRLEDTLFINVTDGPDLGRIISDTTLGHADTISVKCPTNIFYVFTSQLVKCSSVHNKATDFVLKNIQTGKIKNIKKITPLNCITNLFTNSIEMKLDSAFKPGLYSLQLVYGKDNNTLVNACNQNLDTIFLTINALGAQVNAGPDFQYCEGVELDTFLQVANTFKSYTWSTGSNFYYSYIYDEGTYWVKVVDSNKCIGLDTVVVSEVTCTEVPENNSVDILVYPNPASDIIFINLSESGLSTDFRLYSSEGKLLRYAIINELRTGHNVEQLESGLYILELQQNGRVVYRNKIHIQH